MVDDRQNPPQLSDAILKGMLTMTLLIGGMAGCDIACSKLSCHAKPTAATTEQERRPLPRLKEVHTSAYGKVGLLFSARYTTQIENYYDANYDFVLDRVEVSGRTALGQEYKLSLEGEQLKQYEFDKQWIEIRKVAGSERPAEGMEPVDISRLLGIMASDHLGP